MRTGGFSSGVKLPALEADHSPASNIEVKNSEAIYVLPLLDMPSWRGS
jgi:hypothetical protein